MAEVIDIHSHIYPPHYLDLLRSRSERPRVCTVGGQDRFILFPHEDDPDRPGGRPFSESFWSLDAKLEFMDAAGIGRSVLSVGNPWLDPFRGAESVEHAERLNQHMAEVGSSTGGRIVGLGILPNAAVHDAVRSIRSIAADGRLHGFVTGSLICALTLDDPRLDDLWEAVVDAGLPWLLHPSSGLGLPDLGGFAHALPIAIGFPVETTVALARLALSGALVRYRDIKLVAAHGGGAMPFLAGRLDALWRTTPVEQRRSPSPPSDALARIHLDAVTYDARSLRSALDLSQGRLLFGTDHPFDVAEPRSQLDVIDATVPYELRRPVYSENAVRLFGLTPSA